MKKPNLKSALAAVDNLPDKLFGNVNVNDMDSIFMVKLTSGKILKALRTHFGHTQNDVAVAIGISVSSLSAIENDKRNLSANLAAKLSLLYGVRIESLLV
jgi:DNA-binding XRE family transcriptional regulator